VGSASRAAAALLAALATGCFNHIAQSDLPEDPIALVRDAPSEGILSVTQFKDALTIESPDDDLPLYKKPKLRTNLALLYLQTGKLVNVPDVGSGGFPLDWSSDGARLLVARLDPSDGSLGLWTWNRFTGAWTAVSRARTGLGAALADGPIRLAWHGMVPLPGGKRAGGIFINTDDKGDQLLPDTIGCWTPDVSLDGRTVVFARKQAHSTTDSTIYLMSLDEKEPRPITRGSHPRFSRDGHWIVFQRDMSSGNSDIWIMHADGSGKRQLTHTDDPEEYPALSPDARYVVYAATRGDSPNSQIFLARVSDLVEQEVTHEGQASRPVW
jgi:WD40 repeat protein